MRGPTLAFALAPVLLIALRVVQVWFGAVSSFVTYDDGAVQVARAVYYGTQGFPLYRDFREPPYYALEYGPAVPYLSLVFARALGLRDIFSCLELGRIETIAASLGASFMIFLLAARIASRSAAGLVAAAFILTRMMFPYGFEFRPDSFALFADLLGIYLVLCNFEWFGLVFFAAAFLCKQYCVAGALASIAFLWATNRPRRAIIFATGWLAALALTTFTLQIANPNYLLNTILSHMPIADLGAPLFLLSHVTAAHLPLILLALIAIRSLPPKGRPILYFAVFAIFQAGITSLRWGSDVNYFMEAVAASAILAAGGVDRLVGWMRESRPAARGFAMAALAAVLIVPGVAKGVGFCALARTNACVTERDDNLRFDSSALQHLRAARGPILTDWPELSLALPGSSMLWTPELDVLQSMRERGFFQDAGLLGRINRRELRMIALGPDGFSAEFRDRDFFWPPLRDAIIRNYVILPTDGPPILMIPKAESFGSASGVSDAEDR